MPVRAAVFMFLLSLSVAMAVSPPSPANAQGKFALVIGNAAYRAQPLRNPENDATDLSESLRKLGFVVSTLRNATYEQMFASIREFGRLADHADIGLFYFSGHGIQMNGENYLLPVDVSVESPDELPYRSIDTALVLSKMESAEIRNNVIILDACRDNPFITKSKGTSKGLAIVQAPKGTIIIYATAPGSIAYDGDGRNGVFTESLIGHLASSGVDISLMIREVRKEVVERTGGKQIPWTSESLVASVYLNEGPQSPSTVAVPTANPTVPDSVAQTGAAAARQNAASQDPSQSQEGRVETRMQVPAKLKVMLFNSAQREEVPTIEYALLGGPGFKSEFKSVTVARKGSIDLLEQEVPSGRYRFALKYRGSDYSRRLELESGQTLTVVVTISDGISSVSDKPPGIVDFELR